MHDGTAEVAEMYSVGVALRAQRHWSPGMGASFAGRSPTRNGQDQPSNGFIF